MVTCRGTVGVGVQKMSQREPFLRYVPKEEESHEIGETPPDQTQKKNQRLGPHKIPPELFFFVLTHK